MALVDHARYYATSGRSPRRDTGGAVDKRAGVHEPLRSESTSRDFQEPSGRSAVTSSGSWLCTDARGIGRLTAHGHHGIRRDSHSSKSRCGKPAESSAPVNVPRPATAYCIEMHQWPDGCGFQLRAVGVNWKHSCLKDDVRSREATKMKLRTLFAKFETQVFIRLTDDQTAFMCTAKWPLLSRTRRVAVNGAGIDATPHTMESGSTAREKAPVLGGDSD